MVSAAVILASAFLVFAGQTKKTAAVEVGVAPEATVSSKSVFWAYLKTGEKLDASWMLQMILIAENGGVRSDPTAKDFTGLIVGPNDTQATPTASCTLPDGSPNGATCEISYTATTDGIYKIYATQSGNADTIRNMTVYDSDDNKITGRIWANTINFNQSTDPVLATTTAPMDLTYYAVNDAGNIYKVQLDDYNGLDSTISLNAAGNVATDGTCTSSYISTSQSKSGIAIDLGDAPYKTPATNCTKFRLFVDGAPNADLPVSANSADGILNILPVKPHAANTALADLEPQLDPANLVSNLKFTESQTATNKAGVLTFNIDPTFSGNYKVLVDVNNNGSFDDAVDRAYDGSAVGGIATGSVDFDGKDGQGANISPNSTIKFAIKFDRMGEIHLQLTDAEGLGGITMVLMNGNSAGADKIYWNDTQLSRAGNPTAVMNETPQLCADVACGGDGVVSNVAGGVHGWTYAFPATVENGQPTDENGLQMGGWGNRRSIDTWTYIASDAQASLNEITDPMYVVKFVSNGGGSVAQQKVPTTNFAKAVSPADLTREHYTFAGWFTDDKTFVNDYNFANNVTGDITLYAKWDEIRHDVSFDLGCADDENCSMAPATESVFDGDSATEPNSNPTRENYVFKGWQVCAADNSYTGANELYDFAKPVTDAVKLCAVWNPRFVVEFVDENGEIIKTENVENGDSATAPEPPAKPNYKFKGWDKTFDEITGDLIVTAIYEENPRCEFNQNIYADDASCRKPVVPGAPNTGIAAGDSRTELVSFAILVLAVAVELKLA